MSRFGVPPSLGVPVRSCRHPCDAAGAFCFQRVAPAGDVACQERRGQTALLGPTGIVTVNVYYVCSVRGLRSRCFISRRRGKNRIQGTRRFGQTRTAYVAWHGQSDLRQHYASK